MTHVRFLVAGALVAACAGAALADAAAPGAEIIAKVSTFKSQTGQLGCRLFSDPKGFPEKPPFVAETVAPLAGKAQTCRFANVAPGKYAVAVMHDENNNRKLDKNFLGKPVEGYGVSNNHTNMLRAPDWEPATFQVASGKPVQLSIELRY